MQFDWMQVHISNRSNLKTDLHADADGAVAHVGPARCFHWVVVDVYDLVQILGHLLCDLRQLDKIEIPASAADELQPTTLLTRSCQ